MRNSIEVKSRSLFVATIARSIGLGTCSGDDGVTDPDPADDSDPAWSPDGKKIAFTSDRNGQFDIYVMNLNGTGLARLTTHSALDDLPVWRP